MDILLDIFIVCCLIKMFENHEATRIQELLLTVVFPFITTVFVKKYYNTSTPLKSEIHTTVFVRCINIRYIALK